MCSEKHCHHFFFFFWGGGGVGGDGEWGVLATFQ